MVAKLLPVLRKPQRKARRAHKVAGILGFPVGREESVGIPAHAMTQARPLDASQT